MGNKKLLEMTLDGYPKSVGCHVRPHGLPNSICSSCQKKDEWVKQLIQWLSENTDKFVFSSYTAAESWRELKESLKE